MIDVRISGRNPNREIQPTICWERERFPLLVFPRVAVIPRFGVERLQDYPEDCMQWPGDGGVCEADYQGEVGERGVGGVCGEDEVCFDFLRGAGIGIGSGVAVWVAVVKGKGRVVRRDRDMGSKPIIVWCIRYMGIR
jgi:hypothetical protein